MKELSTKTLERKLSQLHKKICNGFPIMRGSVTELGTKTKHPHFSVKVNQKTKLIYLGVDRARIAKKCSTNYKNLMKLIDEMTLINMELLKKKVDITKIDYENL